jgi:Domain of unknown function (DUF4123)
MPASSAQLAEALRTEIRLAPGESLYGIVDSAREIELAYEAKCLYEQEIWSLFEGDAAEAVADVAPYLMMIDPAGGYLENWVSRWGNSAGILLTTSTDRNNLYAHLRQIFIVEDEDHQPFFFRYYDPRVLRNFLPTCTPEQLAEFFGPVTAYLCEDEASDTLLVFRPHQGSTHKESLRLSGNVAEITTASVSAESHDTESLKVALFTP